MLPEEDHVLPSHGKASPEASTATQEVAVAQETELRAKPDESNGQAVFTMVQVDQVPPLHEKASLPPRAMQKLVDGHETDRKGPSVEWPTSMGEPQPAPFPWNDTPPSSRAIQNEAEGHEIDRKFTTRPSERSVGVDQVSVDELARAKF
jgi:hypothetical protein